MGFNKRTHLTDVQGPVRSTGEWRRAALALRRIALHRSMPWSEIVRRDLLLGAALADLIRPRADAVRAS
jgi:hypothetical protein